jgi:hypothetical protein
VRFQILTAASMKFRVFWDAAPLKWTDVSEVRNTSIIRVFIALIMEVVRISETCPLQRDYTALHPRKL